MTLSRLGFTGKIGTPASNITVKKIFCYVWKHAQQFSQHLFGFFT